MNINKMLFSCIFRDNNTYPKALLKLYLSLYPKFAIELSKPLHFLLAVDQKPEASHRLITKLVEGKYLRS